MNIYTYIYIYFFFLHMYARIRLLCMDSVKHACAALGPPSLVSGSRMFVSPPTPLAVGVSETLKGCCVCPKACPTRMHAQTPAARPGLPALNAPATHLTSFDLPSASSFPKRSNACPNCHRPPPPSLFCGFGGGGGGPPEAQNMLRGGFGGGGGGLGCPGEADAHDAPFGRAMRRAARAENVCFCSFLGACQGKNG